MHLNNHRLSFCNINNIANNITEVKIDDDIVVDEPMVDEFHNWLAQHHNDKFGLLVNKTNHYTYTFEAQLKLGRIENMQAAAFFVKEHSSEVAIQAVMGIKKRRQMPNITFYNHQEAVDWLQDQLSQ